MARHRQRLEEDTTAGLVIGIGYVLSLGLMALHPSLSSRDAAGAIAELTREAPINGLVHGGLIVLAAALVFGLTGFCARLGWQRSLVRAGMVAYGLGSMWVMGAALVSGFLVPALARRFEGGTAGELEGFRSLLRLCHDGNQLLAISGVLAMSAGIVSWSILLARRPGPARWAGAVGLLAGAVPILGLLTGHLRLHIHGMGLVVLLQGVWGALVAWWMLRVPVRITRPPAEDRFF